MTPTPSDIPQLTAEEEAELVARVNANPNLHPMTRTISTPSELPTEDAAIKRVVLELRLSAQAFRDYERQHFSKAAETDDQKEKLAREYKAKRNGDRASVCEFALEQYEATLKAREPAVSGDELRPIMNGLRREIETKRKEMFCTGADCSDYEHGIDEGFSLALSAFDQSAYAALTTSKGAGNG